MKNLEKEFFEKESFRPFLIPNPNSFTSNILLFLRLIIDTPHRSLISKFKKNRNKIKGKVLDVGAGDCFYKRYLNADTNYIGLEIEDTKNYFANQNKDLVFYDGKKIPFKNEYFDNLICFEVLEHTFDYNNLIKEMNRVLKKGGNLYLSVPFAAKFHYIPFDYFRYTPASLKKILEVNSFKITSFERRGADISVALHFITVAILGLIFERKPVKFIIGLLFLPIAILSAILANIFEYFDFGAPENTLGYFIICTKFIKV